MLGMNAQARRGRRWQTWLGLGLVLCGLSLLGYVGWQMYVTNWISERAHAAIVDEIHKAWDEGDKTDKAGKIKVDAGVAEAIVRIPRFGDNYAVPMLEGVEDSVLAAGIGRFTEGAEPGQKGNFSLAAHRVTHGEPFREMPSLEVGDEVIVETRDKIYTYVLDTAGDSLTVPFTQTWVIDRKPVNPDEGGVTPDLSHKKLITLTTCSELFHTDGRLIAWGHLVDTEPR